MKYAILVFLLLLSACSAANSEPTAVPTVVPSTATPVPTVTPTPDNSPRGQGEVLFNSSLGGIACSTCHYSSERRLIGPGLAGLAERFESYGLEGTVEEYIHSSIVDPRAFIAHGEPAFPENIMPVNYGELLSEEDIENLIAYILSL
jgi:mono/diheme cytochrome c family protein